MSETCAKRGRGAGYVLPEAVLELKQAAGRLIRSSSDTGVLVLADSRLVSKGYGKKFLSSLPTGRTSVSTRRRWAATWSCGGAATSRRQAGGELRGYHRRNACLGPRGEKSRRLHRQLVCSDFWSEKFQLRGVQRWGGCMKRCNPPHLHPAFHTICHLSPFLRGHTICRFSPVCSRACNQTIPSPCRMGISSYSTMCARLFP